MGCILDVVKCTENKYFTGYKFSKTIGTRGDVFHALHSVKKETQVNGKLEIHQIRKRQVDKVLYKERFTAEALLVKGANNERKKYLLSLEFQLGFIPVENIGIRVLKTFNNLGELPDKGREASKKKSGRNLFIFRKRDCNFSNMYYQLVGRAYGNETVYRVE